MTKMVDEFTEHYAVVYHQGRQLDAARAKKDYWKATGSALLNGELGMVEKWCAFVDEQVENPFLQYKLMDELLQVMTLIKSGVEPETVKGIISSFGNPELVGVLTQQLYMFIHPELVEAVTPTQNVK